VAKLQAFNRAENKMSDFLTAYKLYQNKNEECSSKEAGIVDTIICIKRIGGYLKREYNRRFGK